MKDDLLVAKTDFEALYNRLADEHKKVCAKYAELDGEYKSLESEFVRMRAQLDIVYLIFGK